MYRICLLILCFAPLHISAQNSKTAFTVDGRLENLDIPVLYINYPGDGKVITDSALVVNGKYSFNGTVKEPMPAMIYTERRAPNRNYITIFLDEGTISVTSVDALNKASVRGTKAQLDYQALQEGLNPLALRQKQLSMQYRQLSEAKDEAGLKQVSEDMKTLNEERRMLFRKTVEKDPASPLAAYALSKYAGNNVDVEEVEPLFLRLPAVTRESAFGKALAEKLEVSKKTAIGSPAPAFTQNDTLSNPVSLASFKGKYVLIDFWASWCGPCRKENPHVVAAFNEYKDRGFTVLGVSLDREDDKDKWLRAIHQDKLAWTHVSDLRYWENAAAKLYGVQAIPQNFLVDPNGRIIAKNLRGEALTSKLAELIH